MSAIAALKGYRTQFLYSLYFILSNVKSDQIFRLEGEEDLDVLDNEHNIIYAIQLKNLSKPITLSDILSDKKTSFIKRFIENYVNSIPMLVSYGEISQDLKSWNQNKDTIGEKEKGILKKYKISTENWKLVKSKVQFLEVNEERIAEEVQKLIKSNFKLVDPIPTTGFLLHWLQLVAEKQQPITTKDFFSKVEDFGLYLSERIAIQDQYGIILIPLHKISTEDSDCSKLENEFYNATSTKYEHVLLGLEVHRKSYLEQIHSKLKESNTVIVKGASGQGKTTLVYSYVHNYINDSLAFELNIQEDPIITQKSIQAIATICKKLDVPVVFVINVTPNNTSWLDVIKKTTHYNYIRFIVAIRNEDWYRATAVGVEFEHQDIDLILSRQEAEMIYSRLNEINQIKHYTDFDEAWIQIGDNAPLLELVYSLTQGESLYKKLKQQVHQILKDGGLVNNPQIDFLRTVSLADAFGAKIDVSKLDSTINYQFIIEKLENEYLIKISTNRKCIQGLHIVRSQKLVEILFDEFASRKEEYAYKCIPLIAEEDLYLFLVLLFHLNIFDPEKFMNNLHKIQISNWSICNSILKTLLWVGIREYVEHNRSTIDECRTIAGDAWIMFIDFMFSSEFDRDNIIKQFNIDPKIIEQLDCISKKVSPNTEVFARYSKALNQLTFPQNIPISNFEWKSFGEILFWLRNIEHNKDYECPFSEESFERAFKTIDSRSLSKLMLGMYSNSEHLNKIRLKFQEYFVDRIKFDFDIAHMVIGVDEICIHFVVDLIETETKRHTNKFAVNILDILRTAFPDKNKFSSQGHGHRLKNFPMENDETNRSISIKNLPLEEWTKINSCIIKLYEYNDRPEDWNEYCARLNQWEETINAKITEFNNGFREVFRGSKTYLPVVPVIHNIHFRNVEKIKEPKSITDPLGIYSKNSQRLEEGQDQKNDKLLSKYEKFFKCMSDLRYKIELFLNQSAITLKSVIQSRTDENHVHNEHLERLSQINLYDAINKLKEFNILYKQILGNLDANHSTQISTNSLIIVATFWKDFLNSSSKGDHSHTRILKLKSDFEHRLNKSSKQIQKNKIISIKFTNYSTKPTFIINCDSPSWWQLGMNVAYNIIREAVKDVDYTSLKYLMLQLWFQNFYLILTVRNKTINNQWTEIPLFKIKNTPFDECSLIYFSPKPIEAAILQNLKLQSWTQLYSDFSQVNTVVETYNNLVIKINHFYDLRKFNEFELNETQHEKFSKYINQLGSAIQNDFQIVLNAMGMWVKMFPLGDWTEIKNEEEIEYHKAIIGVKDHLFPEPKDDEVDYHFTLNMQNVEDWTDRLTICSSHWTIFILILYAKYIDKYSQNKKYSFDE
jgi:hypothetical protein